MLAMGSASRRKGASGEREVAALIQTLLGVTMRRRLCQYQTTGQCDLEPADGSGLLAEHAIEVKRHRRITQGLASRWWKEAIEQAKDCEPVLWMRGDGEEWRVRCHLEVGGIAIDPIVTAAEWAALIMRARKVDASRPRCGPSGTYGEAAHVENLTGSSQ